ncbi:C3a anaphylatoxin chemotactic receptor-like [Garra rufa]|uniref:C3a anaphylatoxin chemotactic receptor-like n=1 Tax=Garra rufa TaxID=137080 RepID=UPI003CCE71D2
MTWDTAQNTTYNILEMCFFFPTFVVGLIGNGLVIFLISCRMKTTVNSIWFLNLAVADFIFLLSSCIGLFSFLGQWRNVILIDIFLPLNMFASIFFLVVISLDRCLCTWMVVWAQNERTLLRARIISMIVWVLSIGCSIPFFVFFLEFIVDYDSLIAYEFTVGFLIPLLIIASSYTAIGVQIKRFKSKKQLRSYRVIITVILAFFICWFPYHVSNFYSITSQENDDGLFGIVSMFLVYLNSCLNPILYVFMCDDYKKKLKQSLLLVLETAFAEDHLDFKADAKRQAGHKNQTELLDMKKTGP